MSQHIIVCTFLQEQTTQGDQQRASTSTKKLAGAGKGKGAPAGKGAPKTKRGKKVAAVTDETDEVINDATVRGYSF